MLNDAEFVVMTFNILYSDKATGYGTVDERRKKVISQIEEAAPDILGLQECTEKWYDYLCEDLGEKYCFVGEINDPQRQRWRNPIFYRRDRFELLETKTRWLTETPDVQSKLEMSKQYRVVTHVKLKDHATGNVFVYCNTHMGFEVFERDYQFGALIKLLGEFQCPLLLTGDFNMTPTWPEYARIQNAGYISAHELTDNHSDKGTFPNGNMLDFCFVTPSTVKVISHEVMDNIGASDHNPVVVHFSLDEIK